MCSGQTRLINDDGSPVLLNPVRVWSGVGARRQDWLSLRLQRVIPGYLHVVRQAPFRMHQKWLCYGAIAYRLVAPQTWIKQFLPGRYTET